MATPPHSSFSGDKGAYLWGLYDSYFSGGRVFHTPLNTLEKNLFSPKQSTEKNKHFFLFSINYKNYTRFPHTNSYNSSMLWITVENNCIPIINRGLLPPQTPL